MIKTMNSKMTTNSELTTTEAKKKKTTIKINKLSNQLEQELNHRNGDHMESYQWGGSWGKRYRD